MEFEGAELDQHKRLVRTMSGSLDRFTEPHNKNGSGEEATGKRSANEEVSPSWFNCEQEELVSELIAQPSDMKLVFLKRLALHTTFSSSRGYVLVNVIRQSCYV